MQEPERASIPEKQSFFPLISLVWLQRETFFGLFQNQDPALLIAREAGTISLVTQKGKLFEADKHEISVSWPWYQFGVGARFKVAGKTYWFAWVPGSATAVGWSQDRLKQVFTTLARQEGFDNVYLAERKVWRNYLKA